MPQSKRTNRGPSVTPGRNVFRGIRDPLCNDANTTNPSPAGNVVGTATTSGSFALNLSALGIQGLLFSAGAVPSLTNVGNARLPFLFRTAQNFQEYRVTRATLIITGTLPSTATGRLAVTSTTDVADSAAASASQILSGFVGGRTFDIGSLGTREARVPLAVSTDWKKCSFTTFASLAPSSQPNAYTVVNSANDLIFTSLAVAWSGALNTTASTDIFVLSLEYDVEFRKPTSYMGNV